jgi:hypothetical protein
MIVEDAAGCFRTGLGLALGGWTRLRYIDKPLNMRASLRRQTIALVAAYALALQALLPSLALVAGAGGTQPNVQSEICTDAATFSDRLPGEHRDGCSHGLACLATGCAGMAAMLARAGLHSAPDPSRTEVPALHPAEWAAAQIRLPHSARAPPGA